MLIVSFFVTVNWHKIPTTTASTGFQPEKPAITIGYSNWAGWWIWAIAEQEGLFTKNEANVELRWFDNYSECLEALASGDLDGNCQTLSDTLTFAESAVNGEVAVLVNDNSAGNDKIIVTEEIDQIKDLAGKTVGVEAGVVDDFLLTLALEKADMERDDVEIIDIETGAAAAAFAAGQIDAVGAFPPFWLTALGREGSKELISSKEFPGAIPDLLVVSQQLIDEQQKQVQALIDTWFDTLDFMAKNPQRSDDIMAERAGISLDELQLFKKGTKIFSVADNLTAFSQGNNMTHLNFAAEKTAEFLKNNLKSVEKQPQTKKLFNQKFVENYATIK